MKCDLNCPPGLGFFCCNGCHYSRYQFMIENGLQEYWTVENGFRTLNGCALGDKRPQECKNYYCGDYRIYLSYGHREDGWHLGSLFSIPNSNIEREFVDRLNALMQEYE